MKPEKSECCVCWPSHEPGMVAAVALPEVKQLGKVPTKRQLNKSEKSRGMSTVWAALSSLAPLPSSFWASSWAAEAAKLNPRPWIPQPDSGSANQSEVLRESCYAEWRHVGKRDAGACGHLLLGWQVPAQGGTRCPLHSPVLLCSVGGHPWALSPQSLFNPPHNSISHLAPIVNPCLPTLVTVGLVLCRSSD